MTTAKRGRERDEDAGGNNDEPRETTQSSNDSLRLQDAISSTINLREAGNKAFRAGNYEFSTSIYEFAAYKIVYLKGLQQLGAIPSDDLNFTKSITEMQYKLHSNEQLVGSSLNITYPPRAKFTLSEGSQSHRSVIRRPKRSSNGLET